MRRDTSALDAAVDMGTGGLVAVESLCDAGLALKHSNSAAALRNTSASGKKVVGKLHD